MAKLRQPPPGEIEAVLTGLLILRVDQESIGFYRWLVTEYKLTWRNVLTTPMFFMGVGGYEWTKENVTPSPAEEKSLEEMPMCLCFPIEKARMDIVRRMVEDFSIRFESNRHSRPLVDAVIISKRGDVYDEVMEITGYTLTDQDRCFCLEYAIMRGATKVSERLMPDVDNDTLTDHAIARAIRNQKMWFMNWFVDRSNDKLRMIDRIGFPKRWRRSWLTEWATEKCKEIVLQRGSRVGNSLPSV